ncbi:GUN4 protein [Rivularia sp. PCC 7116]|uniref:GUN4 domain-containing protein n=1 Tax=Rivularia sp. PCC 7116 TaxID=373994 RepID=UPI00029EFCAB|nr:GUN4 domain-containing protein [Rivularia sp. PCC 7116]AFY58482.1 GUN4 protein [Rivularia sp. PCC 7116]
MTDFPQLTNRDSPQLSEIQKQLDELKAQVAELQRQINQNNPSPTPESATKNQNNNSNTNVSEKISHIENSLQLVSDIVRYQPLRDMLAAKKWEEADTETIRLIADIAGHKDLEDFRPAEVQHFPCVQLQVIDNLWLTYSEQRFGFSIQARIYQEVGGSIETTIEQDSKIIEEWGKRLGWRENNRWKKCDELDWSLNAPEGSHPARWWNSPFGSKMTNYFLARLMNCEI